MTPHRLFKIRDTETGLFSPGGSDANTQYSREFKWTKKGKIWNGLGPLKIHLQQFYKSGNFPQTWEVIEYATVVVSSKHINEYVDIVRILKGKI